MDRVNVGTAHRLWATCTWTAGRSARCGALLYMEPEEPADSTTVEMTDAAFSDVTAALTSADTLPFFVEELKNSDWCVASIA